MERFLGKDYQLTFFARHKTCDESHVFVSSDEPGKVMKAIESLMDQNGEQSA
jgi:hypothetical protein